MNARRSLAVVIVAVATLVPLFFAVPVSAAPADDFLARINGLRTSHGIAPLALDAQLTGVASGWTSSMAAAGTISHNPALGSSVPGNWTKLGENVGVGGDVESIFNALVASPGHYRNMMDPAFSRIGISVVAASDGRIFTGHDFAAFPVSSSKTSPATTGGSGNTVAHTAAPAPEHATSTIPAHSGTVSVHRAASSTKPSSSTTSAATTNAANAGRATTSAAQPTQGSATNPAADSTSMPVPMGPVVPASIVESLAEVGSLATQG